MYLIEVYAVDKDGGTREKLKGGEVFYVTKGDFERIVSDTFGFNFRADDPWN